MLGGADNQCMILDDKEVKNQFSMQNVIAAKIARILHEPVRPSYHLLAVYVNRRSLPGASCMAERTVPRIGNSMAMACLQNGHATKFGKFLLCSIPNVLNETKVRLSSRGLSLVGCF